MNSQRPPIVAPEPVVRLAARLRDAGHEAWCVGGAVRDALLGHAHLDWDIATSARPDEVRKLFKRTVPVGIEFGTVGVFDQANVMHEVTTFRKDVRTDGRHAVVEFGASLDDDLARRDFTINAIAYNPETGEVRDPFDGQTDLRRGIVRAVGTAADRMREDRLRALRAIRFAARFGFNIEPSTWAAIRESAPHLSRLSPERVKQELEKTMEQVDQPSVAMEWWRESGAFATLVPHLVSAPLARFRALDLLPRPKGDDDVKGLILARLTMLFFGDAPADVESAARALRFSNADVAWIAALARARSEVGAAVDAVLRERSPEPVEIRRWVAAVGRTRTDAFATLNNALLMATHGKSGSGGELSVAPSLAARLEAFRAEASRVAFSEPVELADLAVDGEDLRAAGIPAGPEMGRILRVLLDLVVENPARNTQEELLRVAKAVPADTA